MGCSGWEMGMTPTSATLCWLDVGDLSRPRPTGVWRGV